MQPEIMTGQEGACAVASHPGCEAVVTGRAQAVLGCGFRMSQVAISPGKRQNILGMRHATEMKIACVRSCDSPVEERLAVRTVQS